MPDDSGRIEYGVLTPFCPLVSGRSIAPRGNPSLLIDTRIYLVSFLSAKWPGDPRIPGWKFSKRFYSVLFVQVPIFFLFPLPEESRMHDRGNKGEEAPLAAETHRRRKGGDKCRLLFEKPHALAPAWHVAGARVCEPRSLFLLPLSKWPWMFRPLARWISRILLSSYEEALPLASFRPSR